MIDDSHMRDALPTDTVLREYVIESPLGASGFGMVYRARHQETGGVVAIKEYFPRGFAARDRFSVAPLNRSSESVFASGLKRFVQEARQLEKFQTLPGVVCVRTFFRTNGTAYLVMNYENGLPLSEFLAGREADGNPFTEQDLLAVVSPLLTALAVVHRENVLHRDIKPGNIFIRREDALAGRPTEPVLIDFGAAKQNYLSAHSRSESVFTPGYAPLEQLWASSNQEVGPWTDLYVVGALMWRMIAGGCLEDKRLRIADESGGSSIWSPQPREAEKRAFAMNRGHSDPMPSALDLGADRFAPHILNSIDLCLALYPEDRVQSCPKLLELLQPQTKQASNLSQSSAKRVVATSTLHDGERFRNGPHCPELVVVPAGSFSMGSPHQIWVPSGRTGLSETARHFLMCTGPKPESAEAVLANVRDRLFGWIRQHEQWSGRTFRDEVEVSKILGYETKGELRDGNLDWLEDPFLIEGLSSIIAEALEAGYELNPKFWSAPDVWWEFDLEYFHRFEDAIARSDRFWAEEDNSIPLDPDEECSMEFPDRFDGLSYEKGRSYWEGPIHPITIDKSFAVGVYPITRSEFEAFVNATAYRAQGRGAFRAAGTWKERAGSWHDPGFYQTNSHPIVCVSWEDVQEYVEWLSATTGATYRLLTESEWEYITRAGTSTPFYFGNTISTNEANLNGNFTYGSGAKGIYRERTTLVWAFPANAFGLHDLHGNVSEWTQDCWSTYWGAPRDGSPWECPPSGSDWLPEAVSWHKMISEERVLRGGSWIQHPDELRSASREPRLPHHRASTIGFRVARELRD